MRKYLERGLSKAGILLFKEKHGTRYFICQDADAFCRAAMKVLKDRFEERYYDDPRQDRLGETRAQEIIETNDIEAAFEFMNLRGDAEYEAMDIEHAEEY